MIRALLVAIAVLVAALGWSLWRAETHKGAAVAAVERAQDAEASLAQTRAALAEEREMARRMAGIAADYERERQDAQDRADGLAADLAAGTRRVRHEIAALHTARLSAGTAAARELDAAAQRGSELVAAAVGVGPRCDAVQRGLIEAYEVCRMIGVEE